MSSEELRQAAALMRERAEAATPGGAWIAFRANKGTRAVYGVTVDLAVDYETDVAVDIKVEDAEHIASWRPAVALAVADWLDREAQHVARNYPTNVRVDQLDTAARHALAVARAYLGTAP